LPQLVYWFVTPETFAPGRAASEVRNFAKDTFFTLPNLTGRNGAILFDDGNAHALVSEIVSNAHRAGGRRYFQAGTAT
jgi:hypothetical protein